MNNRLVNSQKLKDLMKTRGWTDTILAQKLGISPSYTFRLLEEERDGGKKLLTGLLKFCSQEGLDIYEFVNIEED